MNMGTNLPLSPQTRYAPKCSATWKSTIQKCFSIQMPCLMCIAIGTTVEEVNVCHLSKRVVFGLRHEWNTSTHFNSSELSTSSDSLCGAVVCSRDTAYALPTGYELLHTLPYAKHYSIVACFLLITTFLGFLHSSGYLGTCSLLDPCW